MHALQRARQNIRQNLKQTGITLCHTGIDLLLCSSWNFRVCLFFVEIRKNCKVKQKYNSTNELSVAVIKKVGKYVQYLEEWNLLQDDISDRVERAVPPEFPQPPKKKRRTEKQDATSQQRIDSYMSNTFLGRMRATGQLNEAPVSKGFSERYKKKSKKAKKSVKIEPKKEGDKQLKQLKFLVGKKD